MSLTPAEEASYSTVIDAILAASDLQTVSAKRIRLRLQEDLDHDISAQKAAINELIQRRFDKFTAEKEAQEGASLNGSTAQKSTPPYSTPTYSTSVSPVKHENSFKRENADDLSDVADDAPSKKKVKKLKVDDDAAFAAKLQAELNSAARPTRGGGPKPPRSTPKAKSTTKVKTKVKRKSAAKITADDDSDIEANSDDADKPERGGAFNVCSPMLPEDE